MLDYRPLSANNSEDVAALFSLLEETPEYSIIIEGRLPTIEDAKAALSETPPGKEMKDKFFGGYWKDSVLVGCMDLIRGYPEPDILSLGLLLFSETNQGQGFGIHALAHIANLSRSW